MFIFDYFRAFLVFNTKKWPFLGINMVYTLYNSNYAIILGIDHNYAYMYISLESSCDKLFKNI